eukprot:38911-Chlamydomonas_euryale.AAC.1
MPAGARGSETPCVAHALGAQLQEHASAMERNAGMRRQLARLKQPATATAACSTESRTQPPTPPDASHTAPPHTPRGDTSPSAQLLAAQHAYLGHVRRSMRDYLSQLELFVRSEHEVAMLAQEVSRLKAERVVALPEQIREIAAAHVEREAREGRRGA